MITLATGGDSANEVGYWIAFYVTAIAINVIGGKFFWYTSNILGVVSLGILLIAIFGSIHYANFEKHAEAYITGYTFKGNDFMKFLPLSSWWYIGVESLSLTCVDCHEVSAAGSLRVFFVELSNRID
jgi:hypothetical protein